jgi:hypothetical protein
MLLFWLHLRSFEDIENWMLTKDAPCKAAYFTYQAQNCLTNVAGLNWAAHSKILYFDVVRLLPWRSIKPAGFRYGTVANSTCRDWVASITVEVCQKGGGGKLSPEWNKEVIIKANDHQQGLRSLFCSKTEAKEEALCTEWNKTMPMKNVECHFYWSCINGRGMM